MIPTLLTIALTNLRRDRVVQAMAFLLPVIFFSIFAGVFGRQGRDATDRVRVALVDEAHTAASARLVRALEKEPGLRVRRAAPRVGAAPGTPPETLDRASAGALVRDGDVPLAIVIPPGFGAAPGDSASPAIELLADQADPVAPQIVSGLLQKVAVTAAPDLLARQGMTMLERYGGPPTPRQRQVMDSWSRTLDRRGPDGGEAPDSTGSAAGGGTGGGSPRLEALVNVAVVDVLGEKKANPVIAFYAAGIAVMFLLFSASGAGGTLLDEVESGTLERLLTSRAGMGTVLAGKWLFITLFGMFQITVMFVWGMAVFRLDLLSHIPGFLVMTAATAAAAAGFGLVLATLCRTRQQLGGLSTILILTQSALGGSMFPRFLMSEGMQKMGLFTFNAWALDGYIKVFWRDAPLVALWPQLAVLAALTVAFLFIARLLARRWETV